jgi:N-acetylmuramidase
MPLLQNNAALVDELAAQLDVEPRALRAIVRVEGGAEGLSEGKPIIRLEVHHLWQRAPSELRSRIDQHFRAMGPRPWEGHVWRREPQGEFLRMHRPGADGQRQEWAALSLARSIHEVAAVEATSWGAAQILGRYWDELGYPSATAFADGQASEAEQLRAMALFLDKVANVVEAVRNKDWTAFARVYNGPGQVEWYAQRLAEAYAKG